MFETIISINFAIWNLLEKFKKLKFKFKKGKESFYYFFRFFTLSIISNIIEHDDINLDYIFTIWMKKKNIETKYIFSHSKSPIQSYFYKKNSNLLYPSITHYHCKFQTETRQLPQQISLRTICYQVLHNNIPTLT